MKNVELRHLRCLVAVAEERSFSRAAKRLGITQPSVSQLLKRLEDVLGHRLVERDRASVALTALGEMLLPRMRQALAAVDSALEEARLGLRGEAGRIRLGLAAPALYGTAPAMIRRFRAERPGVEISVEVIHSLRQADLLLAGKLDLTVAAVALHHPALTQIPLADEALWVVMPRSHRLADSTEIELTDLADEDWIMPSANMPLHHEIHHECRRVGFKPRIAVESDDFSSTFGLVLAGSGVALAAESFRAFAGPDLVLLPLKEREPRLRYYLSYRKSEISPVVLGFVALL